MKVGLISTAGCMPGAAAFPVELSPPIVCRSAASSPFLSAPRAPAPRPEPEGLSASCSRADFLHAVRMLAESSASGKRSSVPPKREIGDVWTVLICCPFAAWTQVFGVPDGEMHPEPFCARRPLHVWEYRCSDGPVRCVGHDLDHADEPWILVARVCCF